MSAKDGGPAFPVQVPKGEWPPSEALVILRRCQGMSLRDYFAGQALAGIIAQTDKAHTALELAHKAYAMANAMIVERAR